jgi:hypothetical protein
MRFKDMAYGLENRKHNKRTLSLCAFAIAGMGETVLADSTGFRLNGRSCCESFGTGGGCLSADATLAGVGIGRVKRFGSHRFQSHTNNAFNSMESEAGKIDGFVYLVQRTAICRDIRGFDIHLENLFTCWIFGEPFFRHSFSCIRRLSFTSNSGKYREGSSGAFVATELHCGRGSG